jgi:hypothetical protein
MGKEEEKVTAGILESKKKKQKLHVSPPSSHDMILGASMQD